MQGTVEKYASFDVTSSMPTLCFFFWFECIPYLVNKDGN